MLCEHYLYRQKRDVDSTLLPTKSQTLGQSSAAPTTARNFLGSSKSPVGKLL